jgi:hypothetical protein
MIFESVSLGLVILGARLLTFNTFPLLGWVLISIVIFSNLLLMILRNRDSGFKIVIAAVIIILAIIPMVILAMSGERIVDSIKKTSRDFGGMLKPSAQESTQQEAEESVIKEILTNSTYS